MKRLLGLHWDAIAGIVAAATALILHLLHIVETDLILSITVVLLALLLLNDLQAKNRDEDMRRSHELTQDALKDIRSALIPPEAIVIGPTELYSKTKEFVGHAQGEVVWFNVCLNMFRPQETFDLLLSPIIENPLINSIRFISRHSEKELWKTQLLPKITAISGTRKVKEPEWHELEETVSFILVKTSLDGQEEALVSFWGEPFMSMAPGKQVPRYVFHVQPHSSLMPRFREMVRSYGQHS